MKYLCDSCERLVELSDFQFQAGLLQARCSKCGAMSRASATDAATARTGAAPAASPDPGGAGIASAPVGTPASRSVTTARIAPPSGALSSLGGSDSGNVVSLRPMDASSELSGPPEGFCPKCIAPRSEKASACPQCGLVYTNFQAEEIAPSPELAAAWSALGPEWGDPTRHDAFVSLAVKRGELATAGRLYRIRVARAPTDVLAQRGRDEVVRLALLPSFRGPEAIAPPKADRSKLISVLIFFGLSFLCLLFLFKQLVK